MPLMRSLQPSTLALPRRLRPAAPRCRGGASSLLRLTPLATARLPTAVDLSSWVVRAAGEFGRSTAAAGA